MHGTHRATVREWVRAWRHADELGPDVPALLALPLAVPPVMAVIALGHWTEWWMSLVVAAGALVVVASRGWAPWVLEPGRWMMVLAIELGMVVAAGHARPLVLTAGLALALVALPVMLKLWGLLASAIELALVRRRHRRRVARWLAAPDDRGLLVRCVRTDGDGRFVARVEQPEPPRDLVLPARLLPARGRDALASAYVLFDPRLVPQPMQTGETGFRDGPLEIVEHVAAVGVVGPTRGDAGAIVVAALALVAAHGALVGLAFLAAMSA